MAGIMSRWVVRHEHPVTEQDVDADGFVRDEVVARWVTSVRQAYLDRCPILLAKAATELTVLARALPTGAQLGRPSAVVASATVTEFHPSSFTLAVRLRGADGVPVDYVSTITWTNPVTGKQNELGDDVRDELIALEHNARHVN